MAGEDKRNVLDLGPQTLEPHPVVGLRVYQRPKSHYISRVGRPSIHVPGYRCEATLRGTAQVSLRLLSDVHV